MRLDFDAETPTSKYVGGHSELLDLISIHIKGGAASWGCQPLSTKQRGQLTSGLAIELVAVVLAAALFLTDVDPAWRWMVALPVAGGICSAGQAMPICG